jgi:enoyl-CoA hydratase/carnithine racemase
MVPVKLPIVASAPPPVSAVNGTASGGGFDPLLHAMVTPSEAARAKTEGRGPVA